MTGFSPSAPPSAAGDMALLQAVLSEAAALGREHMRELVDAARKVFFDRMSDGKGDRKALGLVLQALNLNEASLLDTYPAVLLATFTESLVQSVARPGQGDASDAEPKKVSFRQLSLMDDDAVQERIDVLRLQQLIELKNQAVLSELNALVCAVQGFATVRPDRNPLRPEMYVKALLTTLRGSAATASERLQWMPQMADTLCAQLGEVYKLTCARLVSRGIEEAEFGRAQGMGQSTGQTAQRASGSSLGDGLSRAGSAGSLGSAGVAGGGGHPLAGSGAAAVMVVPASGFNPAAYAAGSSLQTPPGAGLPAPGAVPTLLTVERLHQLLGSEWPGNGAHAGASNPAAPDRRQQRAPIGFSDRRGRPVFAATVPAALDGLTDADDARHVLDRVAAHRQEKAAALSTNAQQNAATATPLSGRDLGNLVGREVVQVMIAKLAADTRLLAPVRTQICRLEAPLLELTQTDPRFFGDKSHPARRLLDTICQRGLAYRDENDPVLGGFVDVLSQGIDALLEQPIDNGEPFARALPVLQEAWSELTQRANQKQQAAMKALLHAEERSLAAASVWRDLERRGDVRGALPFILTFVRGPWVQVIAESRTRRGLSRTDVARYLDLVDDLCWSTRADLTRGQESRLVRMIPGLLSGLRSGLKLIDFPAEASGAFMSELMSVHQGLLRRGTTAGRSASASSAASLPSAAETGRGPTAVFERGVRGRLSEATPAAAGNAEAGRVVRYDEAAVDDVVEPVEKTFRTVHPAERTHAEIRSHAPPKPAAELWFTPDEAAASGFMDLADWADSLPPDAAADQPLLPVGNVEELDEPASTLFPATELSSLETAPARPDAWAAADVAPPREPLSAAHGPGPLTLDDLVPGTRLQWGSDSAPTRGELTWISTQGTMYLFTTETGKTQSLPRRLLERMVEHGLMRRIEADDLVGGALDGVAQEALQNSVRMHHS